MSDLLLLTFRAEVRQKRSLTRAATVGAFYCGGTGFTAPANARNHN